MSNFLIGGFDKTIKWKLKSKKFSFEIFGISYKIFN